MLCSKCANFPVAEKTAVSARQRSERLPQPCSNLVNATNIWRFIHRYVRRSVARSLLSALRGSGVDHRASPVALKRLSKSQAY